MRFDIYHHDSAVERQLSRIVTALEQLRKDTMATFAEVQAAVASQTTVIAGAITLLNELEQKLEDAIAQNNPAAFDALLADINANKDALAAAVVENTPDSTAPPTT